MSNFVAHSGMYLRVRYPIAELKTGSIVQLLHIYPGFFTFVGVSGKYSRKPKYWEPVHANEAIYE